MQVGKQALRKWGAIPGPLDWVHSICPSPASLATLSGRRNPPWLLALAPQGGRVPVK